MSFTQERVHCPPQVAVTAPFFSEPALGLADVLPESEIQRVLDEQGVTFGRSAGCIFTPALTLWAFLGQVMHKEKSCRAAVLRVVVLLSLSWDRDHLDTGNYCRARAKLSQRVLERLCLDTGRRLEQAVPASWRWNGLSAYLVDGTTVTMPDTPENQREYPQPSSQQPGLGFPMVRMVLLLGLASAALVGLALGPYSGKETGEPALFRRLLDQVAADSVLVADRYFCSYMPSWTSARSSGRWAWSRCGASRPRWSAKRSGLTCWRTT